MFKFKLIIVKLLSYSSFYAIIVKYVNILKHNEY